MSCFRNVLFVFFVAFVSSHTAVDATDYIIPEACQEDQLFSLEGDTMSGSTFIFHNNRKANVKFRFLFSQYHNQNATVTFRIGSRTTVYNASFNENVKKESMNFSLSGTWLAEDGGTVVYQSMDRLLEDCYNRTATNLLVQGSYAISEEQGGRRWIWAREGCGVKVALYGIYPVPLGQCNVTLKFGDGTTMNASSAGKTVTSMNGSIFFDIYSVCYFAEVILYYQEDCPSTTAATSESTVSTSPSKSTDHSAVSTPQTTGSSKSTVSMSSTIGISQSVSSTSPIVTPTKPMISTTSATATSESTVSTSPSSGINMMASALPITFAPILSMVQWL